MQIGFTDPWWPPLPASFTIVQGQHWTDYVTAFSTFMATAAAIAVAVFARVEFARASAEGRARKSAAQDRISATAFLLRRQLRSWLALGEIEVTDFESWIRTAQNSGSLQRHLDEAERRMVELQSLSSEAGEPVRAKLDEAFVLFFTGTRRLNVYTAMARPSDPGPLLQWMAMGISAETDLKECLKALEAGPIKAGLLTAEADLERKQAELASLL